MIDKKRDSRKEERYKMHHSKRRALMMSGYDRWGRGGGSCRLEKVGINWLLMRIWRRYETTKGHESFN